MDGTTTYGQVLAGRTLLLTQPETPSALQVGYFRCIIASRLMTNQLRALIPPKRINHSKARQVLDHFYPHLNLMAGTDVQDDHGPIMLTTLHRTCREPIVITSRHFGKGTATKALHACRILMDVPYHCLRSIAQVLVSWQISLHRTFT